MGGKCCCAVDKSGEGRTPIQTGNDCQPMAAVPQADAPVAPAPMHAFNSPALGDVVKDRDIDEQSEGAGSRNSSCDGMTKEQQKEAKRIIKEFVRTMVKGRQLTVVPVSGKPRSCFVSMNRKLDTLKIRANQNDKNSRAIPLADIEEIVVGTDTAGSQACEGLETPLDDLCVTVVLASLDCITFRMADMEARDTLVMCLGMFSNNARAGVEESLE
mmetsp:Transcript_121807/g.190262  ORF Transcript_121807/g.190262 Transcript_121807/m.190262 type:complete len:215 (+) Transcript_121807:133-777(+)